MRFASFGHCCEERLGLSGRAVEQRAWLERRLYGLPALREALRQGRLSYEKARLVAAAADPADPADLKVRMARAQALPCVALRRELEARAEDAAQLCAPGARSLSMPERVAELLAALRAARHAAGIWIGPAECLLLVIDHFLATWEGAVLRPRSTPAHRVLARDGGLCQVPGRSRPAVHAHHVVYRARGGADDPANLVSLCAAHHLHGVHRGWLRVSGQAPAGLSWCLGRDPARA